MPFAIFGKLFVSIPPGCGHYDFFSRAPSIIRRDSPGFKIQQNGFGDLDALTSQITGQARQEGKT